MAIFSSSRSSQQDITKELEKIGVKEVQKVSSVGGGCINDAYLYETDKGPFFVKMNSRIDKSMFEAEAEGLKCMHATNTVRVPMPYAVGSLSSGGSFLIMEKLPLGRVSSSTQRRLGQELAQMHLAPMPTDGRREKFKGKFGFFVDNTIGSTPQLNGWMDDWVEFYRDRRLRFQLDLAVRKFGDRELREKGAKLLDILPKFFEGVEVTPSLIHGDLWSGNYAGGMDEEPVIFDPACYFGHHEAELSIMRMFGGFSDTFFQAYHERIPKAPGFEKRALLYQLYHYLNHLNLFGTDYLGYCVDILDDLTR